MRHLYRWISAGAPAVFNQTCTGTCYQTWVIGPPSNYDNAYFEISYVRVFSAQGKNTVITNSSAMPLFSTLTLWLLVAGLMATMGFIF
jgi:hypothetical protein